MLETVFFIAAALLIVLGAWLAACDAALGVVSRGDVQSAAETSKRKDQLLAIAADLPGHSMATMFARILSETTAAILVTLAIDQLVVHWWLTLLLAGGVMVLASFILVGTSPRAVGRARPIPLITASTPLLRTVRTLIGPLAQIIMSVGDRVTPGRQRDTVFQNENQLLSIVDEAASRDVLEEDDRELIHSIFAFNETRVRAVMVPRTDMVTVPADTMAEDALKAFLESGLSRMPVVGEDLDDIRGILYLRDVVKSRTWRPDEWESAEQLSRPAQFVPESKKADDTLALLQQEQVHVAMVIDEYGGIAGLITLEDLIEELVGEIEDEYDRDGGDIVAQVDGTYVVSSRLGLSELGELFELDIDDEDVDTVGGLVQKTLGRIALIGDSVEIDGLLFEVLALDGRGRARGSIKVKKEAAWSEKSNTEAGS